MALEIQGKVTHVLPEITGEGKNGTWIKREFVIEYGEEYPKKVCFSTWGDKSKVVGNLTIGETVKVSFRPESREYQERWFSDLRAWKIEQSGGGRVTTPPVQNNVTAPPPVDAPPPAEEDDLPF